MPTAAEIATEGRSGSGAARETVRRLAEALARAAAAEDHLAESVAAEPAIPADARRPSRKGQVT
jgi:hypothetical protein